MYSVRSSILITLRVCIFTNEFGNFHVKITSQLQRDILRLIDFRNKIAF